MILIGWLGYDCALTESATFNVQHSATAANANSFCVLMIPPCIGWVSAAPDHAVGAVASLRA
jgi:hypothetical protein